MEIDFDYFKHKISKNISTVEQDIELYKKASVPVSPDNAIGRLTRMEAINAKSVSEANLNNAKLRLLKLKAALDRISDGDYGECLVCENEIAKNRLESVPEATRCIFCAEKNLKNGH